MSERQLTQTALLVANYMTQEQHDAELGTWGYYTKSAFRKFLEGVQISDVLREHLNSSVHHYVDELPTEVGVALVGASGEHTETADEPVQEPEQSDTESEETEQAEPEQEPEQEPETTEPAEVATEETTDSETDSEKTKARRSRRS